MTLPPDLRARVLAAAREEPAPPRRVARRNAAILVVAAYAIGAALMFASGGPNTTARPVPLLVATAAGWTAFALAALWGGFGRGRSMLGRPTALLGVVAVATAPLLFAWAMIGAAMWPEAQVTTTSFAAHAKCFVFTALFAFVPFGALLVARRGSDPVHPRATGAAIGAAAGAWGGVLIDLHCAVSNAEHIAIGHVLPAAALAAAGAWIGGRVLALRAR